MDWKPGLVTIPVSDVDSAKACYGEKASLNTDHDHTVSDDLRFAQLTPSSRECSIALGTGLTESPLGSVAGLQLVVCGIHATRADLAGRGEEVSDVQPFDWGSSCSSLILTATAGPSRSCPIAANTSAGGKQ